MHACTCTRKDLYDAVVTASGAGRIVRQSPLHVAVTASEDWRRIQNKNTPYFSGRHRMIHAKLSLKDVAHHVANRESSL